MPLEDERNREYLARVRQCDRLLGAVYHDLGNVVLPRRGGVEADESEVGRALRSLRRQAAGVVDHLMTVRAVADFLRASGREAGPAMPAGEWWVATARFCRAMLTHGPSLRLVLEDGDDDVPIDARRLGRPILLSLVAIDDRYEPRDPVLLRIALDDGSARFTTEEPLPARRPWPPALETDLEAVGAAVVDRGSDRGARELLEITLPAGSIRPAAP